MKKVLIVYPQMMLGGSTTSLLSLLNELDNTEYQIDLFLLNGNGVYDSFIPNAVNILPYGYYLQNPILRKLYKVISPKYLSAYVKSKRVAKSYGGEKAGLQYLSSADCEWVRVIKQEYDVAIGFLEGYSNKYVANHVNAKRKIAWIHINYEEGGYYPNFDVDSFSKMNYIVAVSEECKFALQRKFPQFQRKCVVVENILSQRRLETMAAVEPSGFILSKQTINLCTTCRISFSSKGLDRAAKVISRLKKDNIGAISDLRWYIIGDGGDSQKLKEIISEEGLTDQIILLGMQTNPYPYVKKMDLFFLPSIWEGKPMAVTEAQILGLPALVTHYSSAYEQIRDGVDGMVVENSEDGVYQGLKYILEHPEKIAEWKENVLSHDYSNVEEIKKVEELING